MCQMQPSLPLIRITNKGKPLESSDRYGMSMFSAIHLGLQLEAQYTLEEYKSAGIACLWPFGSLYAVGTIGVLYDTLAKALVLTAVAGTSAASSPATLTAAAAILSPSYDGNLLFGPDVRVIPVRQSLLLALQAGSVLGFASQT